MMSMMLHVEESVLGIDDVCAGDADVRAEDTVVCNTHGVGAYAVGSSLTMPEWQLLFTNQPDGRK